MKRFAVIGMGRFGQRLAKALTEAGHEVIAVDERQDLIEGVRDEVALAVRLDATDPESLKSQQIEKCDAAIVSIGEDFESNALATATLKSLGVAHVISRASSDIQRRILERIGADEVINPAEEMAVRLANKLSNPNIVEQLELGEGHGLVQVRAPDAWHEKTLGDIDLRKKYEVTLIAIKRPVTRQTREGESVVEEQILDLPMAHTTIREGDVLVLVGASENLDSLPV